ncbi:Phosphoribosylaminoimidazolecarboxamide formyltransferase/IMP cyclohydrolase [Parafrankia sp. Ea1.12]|uniref:bifunctional phosphoribosylaminoimidazolecarboxamide formyltransferase/IMP cyclohydrolase n=1 Tax=Parafrankia sp. Ea1.12 TaxID=573499 RepID=UPI000DA5879A|nr:bifunctional phosphoribosylaminoimidazolecarboxamide formyltransferase/IMP cyclohydrolase [Parafrankia sp. Ea1.12]SQD96582.1 Phosphoribosylaminoimidazolecarboxamide formyltransferase/IMP cyclohydrolase [Parafrankia sp. Ea1.12]
MPARLVVLASGAGTTLQAVLEACADPAFGARVVAVGTDRPDTGAQRRAEAVGVPVFTVRLEECADRAAFNDATAARIAEHTPDLLVLAGYMKVLGSQVIGRFPTVNTHPSLLPAFPGAHAVRDALAAGVRVSGVTVHWVDEGVDTGPVIDQAAVPVEPTDDEDALRARIQAVERRLFVAVIGRVVRRELPPAGARAGSAGSTGTGEAAIGPVLAAGPSAGRDQVEPARAGGGPALAGPAGGSHSGGVHAEKHHADGGIVEGSGGVMAGESSTGAGPGDTSGVAGVAGAAGAAGAGPAGGRPAEGSAELVATGHRRLRRALVSVYDKAGLEELAAAFVEAGVEVVSTGSTAEVLARHGVAVTPVSTVTGFPEVLGGRVKTLHPRVHAGLLADLRNAEHAAVLAELDIEPFDLLVVNLYPFRETVASGATEDEAIEQIDIGGPAMLRAAAKNHASVAVVVSPQDYGDLAAAVRGSGYDLPARRRLAARAFAHTASYDAAVASWFASALAPDDTARETGWPDVLAAQWHRSSVLRYGENPHQRAALYVGEDGSPGLASARQLHGKPMSYNNYTDTDAAWRSVFDFADPAVAVIKHANPCGIAVGATVAEAHRKAHACDPVSAFGGVIAVNRPVSVELAEQIAEIFTEVVVAPDYEPGAVEILARKPSIRLLVCAPPTHSRGVEMRQVSGGMLLQSRDALDTPGDHPSGWTLEAGAPVDDSTLADLGFAWRAVRSVKSNAILLAADNATVGVGMGQVNRVDAARLAVTRAGDRAKGSVAASDAFFPFPDGFQVLADAGVRAVVEPGGSVRDDLVIAAARESGVALYFTGVRHFAH